MSALKRTYPAIVLLILLSNSLAVAQDVVQKSVKVDGKSVNYLVLQPSGDVSGILLLLPGKGDNPKGVFKKTALPEKLLAKGYMTIVPNLKYALFADEMIRKQLGEILKAETESRPSAGLAIGGFSAGGAVALSYAEHLASQEGATNLKSVFVIDPPLDLQRLYATSRKTRRFNCPSVASEGQQTIDYLDKALGGSPDDQYNNYVANSPYMASESDGGNAKWLKQLPVRLYTEPDIDFVKERQCAEVELQDLNAGDLEKLNKQLRRAGNDRCELIITKGRGYHSWNIADADELAAWVGKF
jgi:hypothetical protein